MNAAIIMIIWEEENVSMKIEGQDNLSVVEKSVGCSALHDSIIVRKPQEADVNDTKWR